MFLLIYTSPCSIFIIYTIYYAFLIVLFTYRRILIKIFINYDLFHLSQLVIPMGKIVFFPLFPTCEKLVVILLLCRNVITIFSFILVKLTFTLLKKLINEKCLFCTLTILGSLEKKSLQVSQLIGIASCERWNRY